MLNKIRNAKNQDRILPDIQIDYDTVTTANPLEIIAKIYPDMKKTIKGNQMLYSILSGDKDKKSISIIYQEDFEPNYFIVRHSTHDGTLIFTQELYINVFKDIMLGSSFCKSTNDDYEINFWDYNVKYTIGNIYNFRDCGLKSINGKKMHGQTEVLVLPVKFKMLAKAKQGGRLNVL